MAFGQHERRLEPDFSGEVKGGRFHIAGREATSSLPMANMLLIGCRLGSAATEMLWHSAKYAANLRSGEVDMPTTFYISHEYNGFRPISRPIAVGPGRVARSSAAIDGTF